MNSKNLDDVNDLLNEVAPGVWVGDQTNVVFDQNEEDSILQHEIGLNNRINELNASDKFIWLNRE